MLKLTVNKLTSTLGDVNIPIVVQEELADSSVARTFRSRSNQIPAFSHRKKTAFGHIISEITREMNVPGVIKNVYKF